MDKQMIRRMESRKQLEEFGQSCIISDMDISPDDQIMDVGAFTGSFSLPISNYVSEGHVYAVVVDDEPLEILKRKILKESIDNITPIHLDVDTLAIEHSVFDDGMDILGVEFESMDKMFMCTVLHEIEEKERFLKTYSRFLKSGGKIYIVEFASEVVGTDLSKKEIHKYIPKVEVEKLLKKTCYVNISAKKINERIYMISAEKE